MQKLTQKQVNKKYFNRYVEFSTLPSWDTNDKGERLFEIRKSYKEIHENTSLGQDVGTSLEYTR
jgi:lipopolysaccharide biosynthesis glycosyltransferase